MRRASFACHSTIKSELKTGVATNPNFSSPTGQQASPQYQCPHNNNLSLAIVLLFVALLTVPTAAAAAVEIPCMPTFEVESHTSYTLTNCNLPNGVNPFVVLTPASLGSSLIANITVDVVGGNVLPCLTIASRERAENIAVSIRGAVVGPHVNRSSIVNELYSAIFSVTRVSEVTNVSIIVENSMIDVTMAPLLQGNVGALVFVAFDANVYGALVLIQNSSITVACTGQIPFHNTAVLVQVAVAQTLFDLNVTVVGSSAHLDVNATTLTAAMDLKASMVAAYCIAAVCNAAAITVSTRGPSSLATYLVASGGVANASGVIIGNLVRVSIVYMVVSELRDVAVRWDVGTRITAAARCTQVCERALSFGYLTAYGVYIGSPRAGNVSLCADGVSFAIEAPETAIAFRLEGIDVLDSVRVVVHFSNATFLARGLDVGSSPRQTAIVQVDAVIAQDVVVVLEAVQVVSRAVSGGCKSVTVSLVRLDGSNAARSINSHIRIRRSSLVVAVVNGTAPVVSLIVGLFTTITALIHFAPGSGSMTVANVTIEMINSTVAAEHSTNLPLGAPLLLVASLIAALVSMSSMLDTRIHLLNVHVQRSFPVSAGPASWFPATFAGSRLNATCLVSYVDLLSMMASEGEILLLVASFVGAPATTTHTNVTTILTSNSVGYVAELVPTLPDEVGVVILPAVLHVSRISIDGAVLFPERQDAAFGFCMSSVGAVRVLNSAVEVSTIPNAIATLISVVRGNLTLAQCTTMTLSNVSVRAQRLPTPALAAPLTPFTSGDGAIIFDSSACTAPPPPLRLTQSYVNGFAQLVDPLKFRVPQQQGASVVLLALGCNLWDGAPLPPGSIGLDDALRPLVSYPRSAFNDTLACDGFLGFNHTPEVSHSVHEDMPPPVAPPLVSATVTIATAALVYATLLPAANSVGRGAIPGLQRATAVRRLAARCVAQSQFEGDASADRQPPMLSQLMDNPLRLTISVDSDTLSYAAGAAVGNMLLVCVVAAVLHALHAAQLRWASSPQYLPAPAVVLRFLPSCPVPSAPAVTFSRLLQPAVGACVVLLASSERSVTSIACGAAMLVLWAVYPAYCIVMVEWRGRRDCVFILASHAARKKPQRNCINNLMVRTLQYAVWYATTATRQWAPHAGSKHRGTPVHHHAQFLLREMGAVFDAFVERREWYFAVEWGIAGLSGAVLGAAEASAVNDDACAAVLWGGGCAVGLGSAQLVLCIWLRPYSMRLELWMAVVLGCLELLSNALSLADQLDSADMAVTAAVLVEIAVAVVMFAIAVDLTLTSTRESSASHPIADRTRRSRTSTREMALRELILLICSSK